MQQIGQVPGAISGVILLMLLGHLWDIIGATAHSLWSYL